MSAAKQQLKLEVEKLAGQLKTAEEGERPNLNTLMESCTYVCRACRQRALLVIWLYNRYILKSIYDM